MNVTTQNVSLRDVTDANRAKVKRLRVTHIQRNYVASVSQSFADAAENPDAQPWYRAVYSGPTAVGFVMIADGVSEEHPDFAGPYYLWRLLIDEQWQGHGIGRAALDLVVDYVRTRPNARTLQTSVAPGSEGSPRGFYLRYGFTPTGHVLDGEELLSLPLTD
jgi:diamine N-acetyltransferase